MMGERGVNREPSFAEDGTMSLFEHLEELRQRLLRVVIALVIGTLVGTQFASPVLAALLAPLGDDSPIAGSPTAPTVIYFKIALVIGTTLAMPVIVYQIFQFLRPGLKPGERRLLLGGTVAASGCFAGGILFAIYVVLPAAIPFLRGFLDDLIRPQYTITEYVSLLTSILLWAGLVFETPLVMFILARLNVVTARGFAKARRVVIVAAAVGAAVVTPTTDIVNMLLLMGPFLLLYEAGILLAWLAHRRSTRSRKRR